MYFNTDEMLVKFIYKDNSTSKEVTSLGLVNESKTYDVAVCTNKKDLNLYLNANTPATDDGTGGIIPEIILKGVRSWNAQFKSLVDNKYYNKGDGTKPYDFYKDDNIEYYDINFNKLEGRDYNIDNMIYLKNDTTQTVIERFRLEQKFSYWFYYNVVGLVLNPYFIIQPIQSSRHTMDVKLMFKTDYNNYSNIFEFEY